MNTSKSCLSVSLLTGVKQICIFNYTITDMHLTDHTFEIVSQKFSLGSSVDGYQMSIFLHGTVQFGFQISPRLALKPPTETFVIRRHWLETVTVLFTTLFWKKQIITWTLDDKFQSLAFLLLIIYKGSYIICHIDLKLSWNKLRECMTFV